MPIKGRNKGVSKNLDICNSNEEKEELISLKTQLRLYETVIIPVVLYRAELWIISKKNEQQTEAWKI